MTAAQRVPKYGLDMAPVQDCAAVALRRWSIKKHITARRKLAEALSLSPDTIGKWLSGARLIPATHLVRLPGLLGIDFTYELLNALVDAGEQKMLARILQSHFQNIEREFYAGPQRLSYIG